MTHTSNAPAGMPFNAARKRAVWASLVRYSPKKEFSAGQTL
ncbi:hypothetical protein [Polaromonas sp. CG9_12]|nr:hypothetical protein [Polaromonas sp. CG9_12]